MKRNEIESRILACKFELQEFDYISRKIVFELVRKFIEIHPDVDLPEFYKYKEIETFAEERREEIRTLQKKLDDNDYEDENIK